MMCRKYFKSEEIRRNEGLCDECATTPEEYSRFVERFDDKHGITKKAVGRISLKKKKFAV